MFGSLDDVLNSGLEWVRLGRRAQRWERERKELEFHKHYGSSSFVVALMWEDLCRSDRVPMKERNRKGLKSYFIAHYFLWTYPKNAENLASRFDICKSYAYGDAVWKWIKRIQSLKEEKIVWDEDVDEIYAISADGVDFKLWEKKHPRYNIDKKAYSQKFKKCAAKYIIALSIYKAKCVLVAGPFIGGVGDLEMLEASGLQAWLLKHNKRCMLDRGFHSKEPAKQATHAYPCESDKKELHRFKSRARLRQESFNGRLEFFHALSNTFRHGFDKHKHVLEAVVVIVQYQMDNGSPIFAV